MLSDSPNKYEEVFNAHGYTFYVPVNTMEGYHIRRYVELLNQESYNKIGGNKEVFDTLAKEGIERCNNMKNPQTFRTDQAALWNQIQARMKHPVDQHCAIRMGAIACFMEYTTEDGKLVSEDPESYDVFFTQKKEQLALDYPEFYTFFLTLGIRNSPTYMEHFDTLIDPEYFIKREQVIRSLKPLQT